MKKLAKKKSQFLQTWRRFRKSKTAIIGSNNRITGAIPKQICTEPTDVKPHIRIHKPPNSRIVVPAAQVVQLTPFPHRRRSHDSETGCACPAYLPESRWCSAACPMHRTCILQRDYRSCQGFPRYRPADCSQKKRVRQALTVFEDSLNVSSQRQETKSAGKIGRNEHPFSHCKKTNRRTGHLRALLNYPQSYAPILPLIAKSTLHSMHFAFESAASIR